MSCVNMASAVVTEEPSTSTASTSSDADALDLLQRLQQAIFSGQPQMAANVASELAKMRANCSMSIRRSEIQLVDVEVAKEPIRVPVEATTTISDLEAQIYLKHKVPIRGRCVVLLETTLPSQENNDGAEVVSSGSSGDDLEISTNAVETINGDATENAIAQGEWACTACTYINEPADMACLMCETNRVPAANAEANVSEPEVISLLGSSDDEFPMGDMFSNYQELLSMEQTDLITNLEAFECPICEDVFYPGDGVILKTCLHHFCRQCLIKIIESCTEAEIKCPYAVEYTCTEFVQDREIRALLTPESYARYLQTCMRQAESKMANAFHCKTPECTGWCEFDNDADVFTCPVCSRNNCLACQAIHDGMNCAQYQKNVQAETANNATIANAPANSAEEHYLKVMKNKLYDTYDMIFEDPEAGMTFNIAYHYAARLKADVGKNRPALMKRLLQEAVTLSTSLPLSFKSSVFVRCDTDHLVVMKALITGPADTPYANGCFEFDIYFPPNYPSQPMLINFQTTGRHSIRFNPNLYNDGKVCLSLLNTWHGRPEEQWNPKLSTCLQALVSIQSLILVPDPYFNEPGYEHSRKTDHGKKKSREYNLNIMKATVRWAMLEQIRNPTPCFKDIILSHFWLKRNEITNQITQWINEIDSCKKRKHQTHHADSGSNSLRRDFKLLCDEFAKLTPPPGCEALSTHPQFVYNAPSFPGWLSTVTEPSTGATSTTTGFMNLLGSMGAGPSTSGFLNPVPMSASFMGAADPMGLMNSNLLSYAPVSTASMNAGAVNLGHPMGVGSMLGASSTSATSTNAGPGSAASMNAGLMNMGPMSAVPMGVTTMNAAGMNLGPHSSGQVSGAGVMSFEQLLGAGSMGAGQMLGAASTTAASTTTGPMSATSMNAGTMNGPMSLAASMNLNAMGPAGTPMNPGPMNMASMNAPSTSSAPPTASYSYPYIYY